MTTLSILGICYLSSVIFISLAYMRQIKEADARLYRTLIALFWPLLAITLFFCILSMAIDYVASKVAGTERKFKYHQEYDTFDTN